MTTYFITRHPGALEWAAMNDIDVDVVAPHLDTSLLKKGDVVVGTLPVHIAAQAAQRGARYLHLSLDVPVASRGQELSAQEMMQFGARLEEYRVELVKE